MKTCLKFSIIALLLAPAITYASWWNPFSWFTRAPVKKEFVQHSNIGPVTKGTDIVTTQISFGCTSDNATATNIMMNLKNGDTISAFVWRPASQATLLAGEDVTFDYLGENDSAEAVTLCKNARECKNIPSRINIPKETFDRSKGIGTIEVLDEVFQLDIQVNKTKLRCR